MRRLGHFEVVGEPCIKLGIWDDEDLGVLKGKRPAAKCPPPGEVTTRDHTTVLFTDEDSLVVKEGTERNRGLEDTGAEGEDVCNLWVLVGNVTCTSLLDSPDGSGSGKAFSLARGARGSQVVNLIGETTGRSIDWVEEIAD